MQQENKEISVPVNEAERVELKHLGYDNELLRVTLEYKKKLYTLVQERVQRTKIK